tara:strand:+ start:386 stop:1315 length:930 start_codon:yes stop_codon:yes gene_type:complete
MLNKPEFWSKKKSFISLLLIPFSLLVIFFIYIKKKIINEKTFEIPVICIGNIYIGGTGKTPTSILIAKELQKSGKNPVILRKFYKDHKDEYDLIKNKVKSLIVNKNREKGILEAIRMNYDLVILDDGFQDYKIKKNFNIICFNQKQLIGNGRVIPAGPLREELNSLKNANVVLINGEKDPLFERKILNINKNLEIHYTSYVPESIIDYKNKNFFAVTSIGNPSNFFNLLSKSKVNVIKKISYPDHYVFSDSEKESIIDEAKTKNCQIIMTEKDFTKFKKYENENINSFKIQLKIENEQKLLEKICSFYD